MVKEIRQNTQIPLVFMTYANVVFSYGTERFLEKAKNVGMDGLILPDVPFEEKKCVKNVRKTVGAGAKTIFRCIRWDTRFLQQ